MKYASYVHLHTHSHYSLLDGACRLDDLIELAKTYRMPALALTDHGNMFGAIEFYKKATRAGIKPIIGCEAYIAGGSRFDKKPSNKHPDGGYHLILLVRDNIGYQNLIKLCSFAYLEGFYHRPRIDKELLRLYSDGLIATSACMKGEINSFLLAGQTDMAVSAAREMQEIFGKGNFYLEAQNHLLEKELTLIPKIEAISRETGIEMVITNDCHYLHKKDASAHDALLCIQTGKMIEDTDRMRYNTEEIYFKSEEEMRELWVDHKKALENSMHIAERCNLDLELGKLKLPVFPIPEKFNDSNSYLRHECEEGLKQRYSKITDVIRDRLTYELRIIEQMKYAGYFLIVKDVCDYARSEHIRVGPGRGSAAGSIVSYVLNITNVDPIKFDLLFERFLNPERISMPDIDIDFADCGRDRIIKYVINKYGKDNVCQIITFGSMMARAVVRDVGRVLAIPYGEVDRIAKLIPATTGMNLKTALNSVPELKALQKNDKRVEKLLDYAMTLEGLARHCSTHAAGVVIAPSALTNFVPLFKGSRDEITTQYDMKMVEEIGLLKMDFLGLRTLTVIDNALAMIAEKHPETEIDIDNLPLDDAEVYRQFACGETIGIFQFESLGMREYLRRLQPGSFTDITAMNALYRPGPLDSGMIDEYVERKKGTKKVDFLHPMLKEILGGTYGVIVFQEQVLQIANRMAGYSLGKADLLRKAMGKKDAALMAEQKEKFLAGADNNKIERTISEEVFNQIETFARYGFNRAHSTCYALVAYQTAWLKRYYPREFMAALLTSEISNSDRIYALMEECRRLKIQVLPPDINESSTDFTVVEDNIRFGLYAVKNVGENATQAIVEERNNNGKYISLADMTSRIEPRLLNRRVLESLVAAGALDSVEGHRAQLQALVPKMLEYGHCVHQQKKSRDLFAGTGVAVERVPPKLESIAEWSTSERLAKEKEVLGFYVSGHPLDRFRGELKSFTTCTAAQAHHLPDGREITLGGIISVVKPMTDKKGNLMAFATLEDFSGSVELILFSSCYEKCSDFTRVDRMILVSGRVSTREGEAAKLVASEVLPMEQITERFDCQLVIKLNINGADNKLVDKALETLEKFRGSVPVLLTARQNGTEVYIRSRKYAVKLDFELLNRLKELLGDSAAYLRPLSMKQKS